MSTRDPDWLNQPFESLVDVLQWRAARHPDKRAFVFLSDGELAEEVMTFAELDEKARAIGERLRRGAPPGERAVLIYPPGLEYIAAFFGCLYGGMVAVPAYPPDPLRIKRTLPRLLSVASDANATFLLTTAAILSLQEMVFELAPELAGKRWEATDAIPRELARSWRRPALSKADPAFLQYTSGSTGVPKGVVVSHGNILADEVIIHDAFEHDPDQYGVSWLPIYHDMGLLGAIIQPVCAGFPVVLLSPLDFLTRPIRWLSAISRYRAQSTAAPNFAYELCLTKIPAAERKTLDLRCWKFALTGAEPVRAETIDRFCAAFAECGFRRETFYPSYGLAEGTLLVSGGRRDDPPLIVEVDARRLELGEVAPPESRATSRRVVGCGTERPGKANREMNRVLIVDPATRLRCPADRVGEIWVSGPIVAQGYWGRPRETAETFQATLADTGEGPFLRTGDLGYLASGQLVIAGRLKDLIIIRGANFYPQDLELAVEGCFPTLRHGCSAAFSVDIDGEERLGIAVEVERRFHHRRSIERPADDRRRGAHRHRLPAEDKRRLFDSTELFTQIRKTVVETFGVAPQVIALLKFGSIPKTTSGKIQRHACRSAFLEGRLSMVACWIHEEPSTRPSADHDATVESRVRALVSKHAGVAAALLSGDAPLSTLGLDSLGLADLVREVGTAFDLALRPEELGANVGIDELVRLIHGTAPAAPTPGQAEPIPLPCLRAPPLAERLSLMNQRFESLRGQGSYFYNQPNLPLAGGSRIVVQDREMLMLCSHNYLGLGHHPRIQAAARAALERFGTGTHGSQTLTGTLPLHKELEEKIAAFEGVEDAILFSSGYLANLAAIAAIAGPADAVISDLYNHASIVDGARFSAANFIRFRHNDMGHLEQCLEMAAPHATKLVVVDAVFSMDGDINDLPSTARLCRQHGARLMVDQAHSLGVIGRTGQGIEEHFGLSGVTDIHMGTFSKTLVSLGGYIGGSRALIRYLRHTARGYIFSAALTPAQAASASTAFDVIRDEPWRVEKLQQNAKQLIAGLARLGFDTLGTQTPIVPILCGSDERAYQMTAACQRRGLYVLPAIPPGVPEGQARLRATVTAAHSDADIDQALSILEEAGREVGLLPAAGR